MRVGSVNKVTIGCYNKNRHIYEVWAGYLPNENKITKRWDLEFRIIEDESDPIFDEFNAEHKLEFLAINGKTHPISFEITIVATRDNPMTRASPAFLYMIRMRIPFASASATPTIRETRNSLNMTRNRSEN